MQVDFTIIRQGSSPLLAIVATLGWSRATYVRFYANQGTAAWCDGIEHALAFFGGTPRYLLFDNAKAIILERDVYGEGLHRWNVARLWREQRCCAASGVCMTGAPLYTLLHAYPPSR